eukprot:g5860.t1
MWDVVWCPYCGSFDGQIKKGKHHRTGNQKHACKFCSRSYTEGSRTVMKGAVPVPPVHSCSRWTGPLPDLAVVWERCLPACSLASLYSVLHGPLAPSCHPIPSTYPEKAGPNQSASEMIVWHTSPAKYQATYLATSIRLGFRLMEFRAWSTFQANDVAKFSMPKARSKRYSYTYVLKCLPVGIDYCQGGPTVHGSPDTAVKCELAGTPPSGSHGTEPGIRDNKIILVEP